MRQVEVVEKVKETIRKCGVLIVIGPTGCGKTYAIRKASQEMGYDVVEVDADEVTIEELNRMVKTNLIMPSVVVVDLIDYTTTSKQEAIFKVLKKVYNPVIVTAHSQFNLVKSYESYDYVIMFKPDVSELLKLAESKGKELGLKPNYQTLNTRDYRQAILSLYGSEGYDVEESVSKAVEKFFKAGVLDRADPSTLITICDNVSSFYGMYAYLLLKYASVCDMCKRAEPLESVGGLFKGVLSKPKPSYFLEKIKLARTL